MTAERAIGKRAKKSKTSRIWRAVGVFRGVFPTIGIGFCVAFFLLRPDVGRASVLEGLRLAGLRVLPAVFPFLVLSDLLTSEGRVVLPGAGNVGSLFRLPAAGGVAVLLGWLCGFPIGARCARNALDVGALTPDEADRAVRIASVPSPAFLIGAVGDGLLHDRGIGIFLYLAALSAASLTGFLEARISPRKAAPNPPQTIEWKPRKFALRLTDAVRGAAVGSLNLCAYVAFFSALRGAVGAILGGFGASAVPIAIADGLLELSGGVVSACSLSFPVPALALCGAAVGWCGFAVHFQIASVLDGSGFRFGRFLLSKAAQSAICLLLTLFWVRVAIQ